MQLYVLSTSDGQHFLMKHIFLSDRVKGEFGSSLCYGEPRMLDWHGNAKNLKKSVQYMLEKMGGFQVQSFILQASVGSAGGEAKGSFFQGMTEDDIDQGFNFIEKYGPHSHHSNTQLRWISKQLAS